MPIIPLTALGEGWYAAYMTNDPSDGETNQTDTNDFVMLTGLGVGQDGAFEVAQALAATAEKHGYDLDLLGIAQQQAVEWHARRSAKAGKGRDKSDGDGGSAREVVDLASSERVWAVIGAIGGEATHVAEQVVTKARLPLVSTASSASAGRACSSCQPAAGTASSARRLLG